MNRQEAVRRATELVEQMSVEELASQLRFDADEFHIWIFLNTTGGMKACTVLQEQAQLPFFHRQLVLEQPLMKSCWSGSELPFLQRQEPNTMKMKNMKTGIFIRESHSGHPMSIFSVIPAGDEDMRPMGKIRS